MVCWRKAKYVAMAQLLLLFLSIITTTPRYLTGDMKSYIKTMLKQGVIGQQI